MADQSIMNDTATGKAERRCAWCGEAFSFGQINRTLCSSRCKKAAYNDRHRGRVSATQRERNKTDAAKQARLRYAVSGKRADAERARYRRIAAERAVALLLMPLHKLEAN